MNESNAVLMPPSSEYPSLLVIGCGDLGGAVAAHFAQKQWRVSGVRRSAGEISGVAMIAADVTKPQSLAALRTIAPDYVLVALTPGEFSEARYRSVYVDGARNILRALDVSSLRRLFWVSSTSVYHQNKGEWIDESSVASPQNFSGAALLDAERIVAASAPAHTIVRFGGIYGPGRDRLLRQLRSGQRTPEQPQRYSNRIHRDDAVGILQFLLQYAAAGTELQSLYLGVDREPALMSDIERWFCGILQSEYEKLDPVAAVARGGSRRCSSARLCELGYRYLYPTYREGLLTLLDSEIAPRRC